MENLDFSYLINEFHHFGIGPSSTWIVEGLIADWCKNNPIPENFDENDSWHWSIAEMHNLHNQLKERNK